MTAKDKVRADLEALAGAAAKARRELVWGEAVDLGSLEVLASRMSVGASDLTAEEAEELKKAILLLVAELDELRELVRSEHEALRGKLEGSGTRRSAAAAYGQLPTGRR